ncbi:hypothetical protein K438DRAFT_614879 [Mycena galopus ATCC 62051]|nr:hypothetical protein K438DRAFT_614879 [Mycena galopus ATCC 62051]
MHWAAFYEVRMRIGSKKYPTSKLGLCVFKNNPSTGSIFNLVTRVLVITYPEAHFRPLSMRISDRHATCSSEFSSDPHRCRTISRSKQRNPAAVYRPHIHPSLRTVSIYHGPVVNTTHQLGRIRTPTSRFGHIGAKWKDVADIPQLWVIAPFPLLEVDYNNCVRTELFLELSGSLPISVYILLPKHEMNGSNSVPLYSQRSPMRSSGGRLWKLITRIRCQRIDGNSLRRPEEPRTLVSEVDHTGCAVSLRINHHW